MNNAGGSKIKWVINFDNNTPIFKETSPPQELFSPEKITSSGTHEVYFTDKEPETQNDAMESLRRVEQSCQKFKKEYLESLKEQYGLADKDKVEEVAHNLQELFTLIIELAKIINRFNSLKNPPFKEPKKKDEDP